MIITWCVGHMIELVRPEGYDKKYEKWEVGHLPIILIHWKHITSPKTATQFHIVKKFLQQDPIPTGDPCPKCGKSTLKRKRKTVSV